MNLSELNTQLSEAEARYQEWVEPINQFIRERLYQVNIDGYTQHDFKRDLKQIKDRQLERYNPYIPVQLCSICRIKRTQDKATTLTALSALHLGISTRAR